jgi:methionine synthase II (cobalamin-independent)
MLAPLRPPSHVGSLLRSSALRAARAATRKREIAPEALRSLPKSRKAVLGLVTGKRSEMEPEDGC